MDVTDTSPLKPPTLLLNVFSLQQFLFFILTTTTALTITYYFPSHERYWIILATLICSLISYGLTFKARLSAIIFTGIGMAISSLLAGLLTPIYPLLIIYLFLLIIMGILIRQLFPRYLMLIFYVQVFAIISSVEVQSFAALGDRFISILLGVFIVSFFQIIFVSRFTQHLWWWYCVVSLRELIVLNNEIFSCLLTQHYPVNIYLYEKRLHIQKNKYMSAIYRLRKLTAAMEKNNVVKSSDKLIFMQNKIEHFFDLMLSGSELRRRVTDYATLIIWEPELIAIHNDITLVYSGFIKLVMGKSWHLDISSLQRNIQKLDEIYNHVLTVSSREPLVFLLYIFNLKTFSDELAECYDIFNWRDQS